jgi:DNA mismatch repair protein MutS
MMEQYSSIKAHYGEHLLLFRMGDFYEVFFEDAVRASKLLNITLTHRGKVGHFPIPMAGIPHHAAAVYIDRLSNLGLKVAICEQVENPKDAKGIVKRAVTQVVSPGMPFDLDKADSERFMAAGFKKNEKYYLVVIDFTTGEFNGSVHSDNESFLNRLCFYAPKEMMTFMGQWEEEELLQNSFEKMGLLTTYLGEDYFEPKFTEIYIEKLIAGFKRDKTLENHSELLSPIGALAYYITSTQQLDEFFHIRPFRLINEEGNMKVTLSTLEGLEIIPRSREGHKESLLGFMDKTQSAMGARHLKKVFSHPLFDLEEISKRHQVIDFFLSDLKVVEEIREELADVRDIERILAKISTNKANAGDLLNTARAIQAYQRIHKTTAKPLKGLISCLSPIHNKKLETLAEKINQTINDEVGASLDKGNLIKSGCDKKRDRLASLSDNAQAELDSFEKRLRQETGIAKLRVKSNNVAGYFIEVSKSSTSQIPEHFNRRQTLVNSERYTTQELGTFEKEILSAQIKLEKLEREIFKGLVTSVNEYAELIQELCACLSEIDSLQSLAWISFQENFKKPNLSNEIQIKIKGMWHPLIKSALKDQFVCHDLTLTRDVFFGLITGPNMAGKTTVMREVAIVQILAQIGCFVPADQANLGLCDFLFSRLGASDDILKGQSTFMVEMAETAEIIRHATDKSLVILDEVGRGTSTYDGLSIAWALSEHLIHNTKCMTLFATHYHELIEVIDELDEAKNLTVETQSSGDDVQFLYRLIEKGASQSFGLYVAKLAGLPPSLLHRAGAILEGLESGPEQQQATKNQQLTFFPEKEVRYETPTHLKILEEQLNNLDLNNHTPMQVMNRIQDLKDQLNRAKVQ